MNGGMYMRGFRSQCSICGVDGEVFGCPSYYDVCTDVEACRDRAIRNKDREIAELKTRLQKTEEELAEKRSICNELW